jgi:hypothetical protein
MKKYVAVGAIAAASAVMGLTGCTPHKYKNCTDMHLTLKGGVGKVGAVDHHTGPAAQYPPKRDNALYQANIGLDRDKDGIACEQ